MPRYVLEPQEKQPRFVLEPAQPAQPARPTKGLAAIGADISDAYKYLTTPVESFAMPGRGQTVPRFQNIINEVGSGVFLDPGGLAGRIAGPAISEAVRRGLTPILARRAAPGLASRAALEAEQAASRAAAEATERAAQEARVRATEMAVREAMFRTGPASQLRLPGLTRTVGEGGPLGLAREMPVGRIRIPAGGLNAPRSLPVEAPPGTYPRGPQIPAPTVFSTLRELPLEQRVGEVALNAESVAKSVAPRAVLPIGGAQQQTLFQRKAEALLEPTRGLGEAASRAFRGVIRESNAVVSRMGSEGAEAVKRVRQAHEQARLAAGEILGRVQKLSGSTTDFSWEKIRQAREGIAVSLTPKEQALKGAVDQYLDSVVPRARQGTLEVGELPNYWPTRVDFSLLEKRSSDAVQAIMERTGASAERAEQILRRFMHQQRSGRPFGNLERSREHWIPYVFRKPAKQEFLEYVVGAERRISEAAQLGPQDNLIEPLLGKIRSRNPQDAAFAEQWFDAVTHRSVRDVPLEALARQLTGLQAASKMVLSVFSNMSQPANNLLVVNARSFGRGLQKIMSPMTREEAYDFARRTGAALETTLADIAKEQGVEGAEMGARAGERVLRSTGFMRVEGGNRLFTAVVGREWARDLAGQLVRKPNSAAVRRHLEKVRLNADEILGQGGQLTDDQERLAGLRLSELTQFGTSPGELPLFWNSPWARVATQFKRFAYRQGQLLWSSIVDEGKRGNLKPLAVFLTIFPAIGEGVADVRLLLRKGPQEVFRTVKEKDDLLGVPGRVLSERPKSLPERAAENLAYVGGLGLMSDFVRALQARDPNTAVASFVGGPTFAEIYQAGGAIGQIAQAKKPETKIGGARRLTRQVVGQTVTPGLAGAFGLPGSIAGETIETLIQPPRRKTTK